MKSSSFFEADIVAPIKCELLRPPVAARGESRIAKHQRNEAIMLIKIGN
jgi:hypothetical protein